MNTIQWITSASSLISQKKKKKTTAVYCVANRMGLAAIYQVVAMLLPYVSIEKGGGGRKQALVQVRIPKIVSLANASNPPNEQHLRILYTWLRAS